MDEIPELTLGKVERVERPSAGGLPAKSPSKIIGLLSQDNCEPLKPLPSGRICPRFIRNTNSTGVYQQEGGTCYAFAACSAYINTILRIYGAKNPPSFPDCFQIACYNGAKGGNPAKSIELLEEEYNYGIQIEEKDEIGIKEILMDSVIICFNTSQSGWNDVSNGELLIFQQSDPTIEWHASLAEGYDFEKDCIICKNSWAYEGKPRFDFTPSAAHGCSFIHVFFTPESIANKTKGIYIPQLVKLKSSINGNEIDSAYMDEDTALYDQDYVCEERKYKDDNIFRYVGYNCDQFISAYLNRPKGSKYPKYYRNNIIRKIKWLISKIAPDLFLIILTIILWIAII